MRGESIKSFVERRLQEGAAPLSVWHEARDRFPHRCVGRGYVSALNRDLKDAAIARERLAEIAAHPERLRTFRYVSWNDLEDYLRLGWLPAADLGPTHGEWSTLCEWLCQCEQVTPLRLPRPSAP